MDKLITYPVIITEHMEWIIYPVVFVIGFLLLAVLEMGVWVGLHNLFRRIRKSNNK